MLGKLLFHLNRFNTKSDPISLDWSARSKAFLPVVLASIYTYFRFINQMKGRSLFDVIADDYTPSSVVVIALIGLTGFVAFRNYLMLRDASRHNIPWKRSTFMVVIQMVCAACCAIATLRYADLRIIAFAIGAVFFAGQALDDFAFIRLNNSVESGQVTVVA